MLGLRGTRKILLELKEKGSVKYSELVKVVGFSTTTTRALKHMEKLGLIEKKALTEPYRPIVYYLTEKGKRLTEIIEQLQELQQSSS